MSKNVEMSKINGKKQCFYCQKMPYPAIVICEKVKNNPGFGILIQNLGSESVHKYNSSVFGMTVRQHGDNQNTSKVSSVVGGGDIST